MVDLGECFFGLGFECQVSSKRVEVWVGELLFDADFVKMNNAMKTQFVSVSIKIRVKQRLFQHTTLIGLLNRLFGHCVYCIVANPTVVFFYSTLS